MTAINLIDQALRGLTLSDLAEEAGIPVQSLKQYRQAEGTAGHRKASPATQEALRKAIAKLAKVQAAHFTRLAQRASEGL